MQKNASALDKALRSLATRAHSEKEIVDKLSRTGFEERAIAEAMAKLSEYRLVDDAAFSGQWAAHRAKRGLGPRRIAMELRQKGIGHEAASDAITALDDGAMQGEADALAEKLLQRGGENARRRAFDALNRRGFSYDMARRAVERAEQSIRDET